MPEMTDVMYRDDQLCRRRAGAPTTRNVLKKVRDKLVEAKPNGSRWTTASPRSYAERRLLPPAYYWNGAVDARAPAPTPTSRFGYPKEGYPVFMDSVAILTDAQNVENAKLFMNFIMEPENAALISDFASYANGIKGSDEFMPEDMKTAPELVVPAEFEKAGEFLTPCPPEVNDLYTKIWTSVTK